MQKKRRTHAAGLTDSKQRTDAQQEQETGVQFAESHSQDVGVHEGTSSEERKSVSEGEHVVVGKVMASGYAGRLGNWMFRYGLCVVCCVCVCVYVQASVYMSGFVHV